MGEKGLDGKGGREGVRENEGKEKKRQMSKRE